MTKNSRGFLMPIRKTGCEKYIFYEKCKQSIKEHLPWRGNVG